jgi:hypothetical protein
MVVMKFVVTVNLSIVNVTMAILYQEMAVALNALSKVGMYATKKTGKVIAGQEPFP